MKKMTVVCFGLLAWCGSLIFASPSYANDKVVLEPAEKLAFFKTSTPTCPLDYLLRGNPWQRLIGMINSQTNYQNLFYLQRQYDGNSSFGCTLLIITLEKFENAVQKAFDRFNQANGSNYLLDSFFVNSPHQIAGFCLAQDDSLNSANWIPINPQNILAQLRTQRGSGLVNLLNEARITLPLPPDQPASLANTWQLFARNSCGSQVESTLPGAAVQQRCETSTIFSDGGPLILMQEQVDLTMNLAIEDQQTFQKIFGNFTEKYSGTNFSGWPHPGEVERKAQGTKVLDHRHGYLGTVGIGNYCEALDGVRFQLIPANGTAAN